MQSWKGVGLQIKFLPIALPENNIENLGGERRRTEEEEERNEDDEQEVTGGIIDYNI